MPYHITGSSAQSFSAHGPSLHRKSHEEIIALCVESGFSGIEGHVGLFLRLTEKDEEKLREEYQKAGLKIDSFHLPYGSQHDLTSPDETIRLHALNVLKPALRQAAALGARVAIIHPTTGLHDVTVLGFDPLLNTLEKSLAELLPLAESLGVILALENIPPREIHRFGSAPEHFKRFHERFAHPSLGFCLDTGHALLSLHSRAADLAEAMKPRLQAFHLNDNAGDRDSHLAPGRGRVNWVGISQLLREIRFIHPACIEAPPFAFGPDYSTQAWKELQTETARLFSCEAPVES